MATLNTLRTKGGLIVTIVIGISLIAFLLGDLTSRTSVFSQTITVGEINGTKIPYSEYLSEVDYLTNINKMMSGSDAVSQEEQDAINNYAWERLFSKYSLMPGFENLGINVSESEMYDLIYGGNISPVLANAGFFNNQQTGVYDKALVKQFITNLGQDQTGRLRTIWKHLQEQVENNALMTKYGALINKMVYVTNVEAEQGVTASNNLYNAQYVALKMESIADSLVKVSASEIKDYYKKHENYFKQEASRDLEYVVFEVEPSEQDLADAKKKIETLATEFAVAENPSQFALLNSQTQPDARFVGRGDLPAALAEFAFTQGKTGMYGPVLENNKYTMSRVAEIRSMPDSVSLRQIILAPGSEKLADSLVDVLNTKGGNFAELATQYSQGQGNSDMGKIETGSIPTEMLDQILKTPKGSVTKVETPKGIMIVDVYSRGAETQKVQLATVEYDVVPSNTTQQLAYAKTSGFITAASGSIDKFNKTITDNVYAKRVARIKSSDRLVSDIPNSKEMVRWAFNAKKGDVSGVMEIDGNYIVASLVSTKDDGIAPMEQVTPEITFAVRNEKKADMLSQKMTGATSIEELAQKLSTVVGTIDQLSFNAFYIPDLGVEPAVIGAIAGGVKEGTISKPIKGNAGVYVVKVTSKTTSGNATVDSERVRLEATNQSYIDQRAIQAIREMSDIKDSRVKYF